MKQDGDGSPDGRAIMDDLMRFLPDGMTLNGWAVGAGVSRAVWGDIRRHGNPSRRTLGRLLDFVGSSLAEFEALRIHPLAGTANGTDPGHPALLSDRRKGWLGDRRAQLPLYRALAMEPLVLGTVKVPAFRLTDDRLGSIDRPSSMLAMADGYAFSLPVGNMWPRYRQGRRLIVTPALAPALGDDLVITIAARPSSGAEPLRVVAELVWQDALAVRLRYFSPGVEFTLERSWIGKLERIAGEAI